MPLRDTFRNKNFFLILVDLLMMLLLVANLTLIVFDWLYGFDSISGFLERQFPDFYTLYTTHIHSNFFEIDMVFISIFLTEFTISWIISIINRDYYRWFFYPFIHWYDLLGCIPLDAFRWVRIFRVFSIMYRLHKLQIIDLRNTYLFQKLKKYYNILVEEVSDRVVINIIEGIQAEVSEGSPVVSNIVRDVLRPKQPVIEEWVSHRIQMAAKHNYNRHRNEIRQYVERLIDDAIDKNDDFGTIELIPVMGKAVTNVVKNTVSGVVNNVLDKSMQDLASENNRVFVNEITEIVFDSIDVEEEDAQLQEIVINTILRSLELVKAQVRVKRWKIKDQEEVQVVREESEHPLVDQTISPE